YYVAEQFFLYGQFDQARERYNQMWKDNCKRNEYGYKAWERLITMAAITRNADESMRLAEAEKKNSCAFTADQTAASEGLIKPIGQEAAYVKARLKFEEACEAKAGSPCKNPEAPSKRKTWREAGELYEAALNAAPARRDAPEGAMNAAYAYKQIGEHHKTISLYHQFITHYGSNQQTTTLH